jgi:D-alanyl-D-alanine carboxypeptidase
MLPAAPVDYERRMPRFAEASVLQSVGQDVFGREVSLILDAANSWKEMNRASESAGIDLLLISGFRSIARQTEILERKLKAGEFLDAILRVSAYPGHSEHHTGRALDIGSPHSEHLSEKFQSTPEFQWLVRNADAFVFRLSYPKENGQGIAYEPWHWFYRSCRA